MKILRILTRIYVQDIEKAISFYEELFKEKVQMRFTYTEMNLELAQVGNVLIVAGPLEALKPFSETKMTILVDSIMELRNFLISHDAIIIRDLKIVPTGINMTVRHLDGTIVEYVEHKN